MNLNELQLNNNIQKIALDEIDKKIILKFIKEKKTNRTYIYGLHLFIPEKEKRDEICSSIKKELGAGSNIKINENNIEEYGFQGNHIEKIKIFLINKVGINTDKIMFLGK